MNTSNNNTKYLCSFCKKPQTQVNRLIAGPDQVFICDICVNLCSDMLSNTNTKNKNLKKYSDETKSSISSKLLDEYNINSFEEYKEFISRTKRRPEGIENIMPTMVA